MNTRKLKSVRVEKNHTQKSLARAVGMSEKTYNRKELGIIDFTRSEMLNISNILGLNIEMVNEIFFENKLTKRIREYTA
jgi:DNA-binding XRE family transcriptional regulator